MESGGYPGPEATYGTNMTARYLWKGMYENIAKNVPCDECQGRKQLRYEQRLHPTAATSTVDGRRGVYVCERDDSSRWVERGAIQTLVLLPGSFSGSHVLR